MEGGAGFEVGIGERPESVFGNLLGHLNRDGVLAVLGDFLLALDVGSAAATLGLLTMLLTHGGSDFLFVGQVYGPARVDIGGI